MTRTVVVHRTLAAPVEKVYETFAKPDQLAQLTGVSVQVLRAAESGSDGVGIVRRVHFPGGYLVEEITGLQAPTTFDYLVRDASVRFRHEQGRITFAARGEGTDVTWSSTFAIPLGPLSWTAELIGALATTVAFTAVLELIDRQLSNATDR